MTPNGKPWLTEELKTFSIVKNKLYKKFVMNPTPPNLEDKKYQNNLFNIYLIIILPNY